MPKLLTINGYDFYEVLSALQKGIRREDIEMAGYFGMELYKSGFIPILWKRLLTISAEDCYGCITEEIKALYDTFQLYNQRGKGSRIYVAKAIVLLCQCNKSRDSDHLCLLLYDKHSPTDEELNKFIAELDEKDWRPIPEEALDVHTIRGKMRGKTKENFIVDEHKSLHPHQKGLLDYLVDKKEEK